jgi:hypothetical protein
MGILAMRMILIPVTMCVVSPPKKTSQSDDDLSSKSVILGCNVYGFRVLGFKVWSFWCTGGFET